MLLGSAPQNQALQTVADRAREIADADVATVVLRRSEAEIEMRILSGLPQTAVPYGPLATAGTLSGLVVATGESLVVDDLATETRPAEDLIALPGWPALGPVIVVPLRTGDGVVGALTLAWTPDRSMQFYEVDVELPQRFAEQAALALQVARARIDTEKLAVFEDRDRIGRDLHDLVIQRLFAIGLTLENTARMAAERPDITRRVAGAVDDIDATIKDIRRSIFALSAAEESSDIRRAVGDLVDRAARSLKVRPTLRFEGPVNAVVSPTVAPHVLAVLGEALSNVVRHAEAGEVRVTLRTGDEVALVIEDDGKGIPEDAVPSGLRNIEERAEQLGGTCTVESSVGAGTTIRWAVPAH
jgi:signal transduction histidine kinase